MVQFNRIFILIESLRLLICFSYDLSLMRHTRSQFVMTKSMMNKPLGYLYSIVIAHVIIDLKFDSVKKLRGCFHERVYTNTFIFRLSVITRLRVIRKHLAAHFRVSHVCFRIISNWINISTVVKASKNVFLTYILI